LLPLEKAFLVSSRDETRLDSISKPDKTSKLDCIAVSAENKRIWNNRKCLSQIALVPNLLSHEKGPNGNSSPVVNLDNGSSVPHAYRVRATASTSKSALKS